MKVSHRVSPRSFFLLSSQLIFGAQETYFLYLILILQRQNSKCDALKPIYESSLVQSLEIVNKLAADPNGATLPVGNMRAAVEEAQKRLISFTSSTTCKAV
jgi:hypothetical protein